MERKGMGGERSPDIYFIQFLWLSVLIGQTEGRRRWAVKEKPWRGVRTSLRIHTSVNSCHQFFQSLDGWVGRKMLQSECICNLDIYISVIGSEGKVKWAMEKKPEGYVHHLNIHIPIHSCDHSSARPNRQKGVYSDISVVALVSRL